MDDKRVRVGGRALVPTLPEPSGAATAVGVEIDGHLAGVIEVRDEVRPESACTIACLGLAGVDGTVLLTGDSRRATTAVLAETGVASGHSEMLPHHKEQHVRSLLDHGHRVLFTGDGVNDASALAVATVGVSLGRRGTALAVDTADVVIVDDHLHRLPDLVDLARRTRRIVRQNLAFALSAIAVLVALDLAGHLPLVLGVVGHEGSSVIVALNGLRLLRWRAPTHAGR